MDHGCGVKTSTIPVDTGPTISLVLRTSKRRKWPLNQEIARQQVRPFATYGKQKSANLEMYGLASSVDLEAAEFVN